MADFILGEGGQKILEQYEYGSPTKDYGFKRWYPEQGLTTEQYENSMSNGIKFCASWAVGLRNQD